MIKQIVLRIIEKAGYALIKKGQHLYNVPVPNELEDEFLKFRDRVAPFTMTSLERLYSAYKAARYVAENNIEGDVVECGVWRGGSSMMIALTLMAYGASHKKLYLYDTFEGMSEPTEKDKHLSGSSAYNTWEESQKGSINEWCYSPIEEVTKNLYGTGYPKENIFFVKGKVEDTIPNTLPGHLSLLRLDTDWYESTYHEMVHLYPLLVQKGVLVIDDYGHWQGAREAIDQYFRENSPAILLNRIDYTGRIGIKV